MFDILYETIAAVILAGFVFVSTPELDVSHSASFFTGLAIVQVMRAANAKRHSTHIIIPKQTREYAMIDAYISTCSKKGTIHMTVANNDATDDPLMFLTVGHRAELISGITVLKTEIGFDIACFNEQDYTMLLNKVKHEWLITTRGMTPILVSSKNGWLPLNRKAVKDPEALVGKGCLKAVRDLQMTLSSNPGFSRRVYLLHGPRNTGKASTAHSFAGILDGALCICIFSMHDITSLDFISLVNSIPDNSIILMENIDVLINTSRVSAEEISNAIDSAVSARGVFVLTATNLKNVHAVFMNGGVVDSYVQYALASIDDARKLFEIQYGSSEKALADNFAKIAGDGILSQGVIVGILVANPFSAKEAILQLFKLRNDVDDEDEDDI